MPAGGRRRFCFTGEMQPNDRSRLAFMIRYAVRHPGRIVPHARRLARDAVLRLRNRDHVSYYRAVMRSDAARSDEGAADSPDYDNLLACIRCGACLPVCASDAVVGEPGRAHLIAQTRCNKCGACREVCASDAVVVI